MIIQIKPTVLAACLCALLGACGSGGVTNPVIPTSPSVPSSPSSPTTSAPVTPATPSTPIVPITPTEPTRPPAPDEAGTVTQRFGDFNAIAKQEPNPVDGVRYADGFVSNGTVYEFSSLRVLGSTGSPNILYRGDGAYFHDLTDQTGQLAAGIGFRNDGTWLGG